MQVMDRIKLVCFLVIVIVAGIGTCFAEKVKPEDAQANSLCCVCHMDLMDEAIANTHLKEGLTCAGCHGASDHHMHDEMLMTKPDKLYGRAEVGDFCGHCHGADLHKGKENKIAAFRKKWASKDRPNGRAIAKDSICTDCHGKHNIVKEMGSKGSKEKQIEWRSLFNGKNLDGWKASREGIWMVRQGRIVGAISEKGARLLSERLYGDYLLSFTFKADRAIIAHFDLRGADAPKIALADDKKLNVTAGSAWGVGAGTVLANLHKDLYSEGSWNTVSVESRADAFKVWLNGVQIGTVTKAGLEKGAIGFYIRPLVEGKAGKITISEMQIQSMDPVKGGDVGFVSLFNGKDLAGWEISGKCKWWVEGGQLVGTQGENFAPGDLFTKKTYDDFALRVVYRVDWPCNTGVWFRYQSPQQAYQADILEYKKPVAFSGTLYCTGKMFLAANEDKSLVDRDGWNTIEVRAEGDHIQTWINDHKIADVHDGATDTGKIGFQIHPGDQFGKMKVVVREILIKEL